MKKNLLTLLKYTTGKFQALIKKMENTSEQDSDSSLKYSFNSLSPVDNADPEGEYTKALNWALKNKKKCI